MDKTYIVKPMSKKCNHGEKTINAKSPLDAVKQYLADYSFEAEVIKATSKFFKEAYEKYPDYTPLEIASLIDFCVELVGCDNPITANTQYHIETK